MGDLKLEPYMWLETKKCEFKAKITGINPAGGVKPYAEYELAFENGQKLVIRQEIIDMLFDYTGIQGDFHKTYEESCAECATKVDEKDILKDRAKELGIKGAHLLSLDKLKEKIVQVEKGE